MEWLLEKKKLIQMRNGTPRKCYLAGPMRGIPEWNHPAFKMATRRLRAAGWEVFSPHEKDLEIGNTPPADGITDKPLKAFPIGDDLKAVAEADAVFVLDGWENSEGAELEVDVAHRLGVPVYRYATRELVPRTMTGYQVVQEALQRVTRSTPSDYMTPEEKARFEERDASIRNARRIGEEARMRQFDTGATRNLDDEQFDIEGFLSPVALQVFFEYMHKHRFQADGTVRDGDNWQKGIPVESYMKSLLRHVFDLWRWHRGLSTRDGLDEAIGGAMFNIQGLAHELYKDSQIEE